jgi:hypothetical protein
MPGGPACAGEAAQLRRQHLAIRGGVAEENPKHFLGLPITAKQAPQVAVSSSAPWCRDASVRAHHGHTPILSHGAETVHILQPYGRVVIGCGGASRLFWGSGRSRSPRIQDWGRLRLDPTGRQAP